MPALLLAEYANPALSADELPAVVPLVNRSVLTPAPKTSFAMQTLYTPDTVNSFQSNVLADARPNEIELKGSMDQGKTSFLEDDVEDYEPRSALLSLENEDATDEFGGPRMQRVHANPFPTMESMGEIPVLLAGLLYQSVCKGYYLTGSDSKESANARQPNRSEPRSFL